MESVATIMMACCALVVTGVYVRGQMSRPSSAGAVREVKEWRQYAVGNMRIGSDAAPVVVTEFSDFGCPFCLGLYRSLEELRRRYPGSLAIVYRNYPINQLHPFARSAAIAAECSARFGRFEPFYSYLFEHQDSLATGRWGRFAQAAGIRDTIKFTECLRDEQIANHLRADSIAAQELGIRGTPMFLVNKRQFSGNPPLAAIDSVIKAELGKTRK